MKKLSIVFVAALVLTGCFWNKDKDADKGVIRGQKPPVVIVNTEKPIVETSDFYFDASNKGLTLRLETDPSFTQVLSTNPIESAEIQDGILTFVEIINGTTQTQVFQLEALADQFNQ